MVCITGRLLSLNLTVTFFHLPAERVQERQGVADGGRGGGSQELLPLEHKAGRDLCPHVFNSRLLTESALCSMQGRWGALYLSHTGFPDQRSDAKPHARRPLCTSQLTSRRLKMPSTRSSSGAASCSRSGTRGSRRPFDWTILTHSQIQVSKSLLLVEEISPALQWASVSQWDAAADLGSACPWLAQPPRQCRPLLC